MHSYLRKQSENEDCEGLIDTYALKFSTTLFCKMMLITYALAIKKRKSGSFENKAKFLSILFTEEKEFLKKIHFFTQRLPNLVHLNLCYTEKEESPTPKKKTSHNVFDEEIEAISPLTKSSDETLNILLEDAPTKEETGKEEYEEGEQTPKFKKNRILENMREFNREKSDYDENLRETLYLILEYAIGSIVAIPQTFQFINKLIYSENITFRDLRLLHNIFNSSNPLFNKRMLAEFASFEEFDEENDPNMFMEEEFDEWNKINELLELKQKNQLNHINFAKIHFAHYENSLNNLYKKSLELYKVKPHLFYILYFTCRGNMRIEV